MRNITVLSAWDDRKLFAPAYKISETENIINLSVSNSSRAIRKTRKKFKDETVLIKRGLEREKRLCENVLEYNHFSYRRVLNILNKICRQTALKYGIELPFMDFYIMASPLIACEMIENIYDLSRIFTVVSEEETPSGIYDELYFKHGTLIRQLPTFNNHISQESVIVRCEARYYPAWAEIPVIDMSPEPVCGNKCVNVGKISVSDAFMSDLCRIWQGNSGVMFYELIDEYPTEESVININKTADEIFLLDTEKI